MLALLEAACAAERAAVIGRMDERAAAAGATIARLAVASAGSARLLSHGIRHKRTAAAFLPVPKQLAATSWAAQGLPPQRGGSPSGPRSGWWRSILP